MQCLARAQQLEKRVTCGVSLLVRLARAGRCDSLTRGVAIGLLGEVPMAVSASTIGVAWGLSQGVTAAVSAFTQAQGDGNSLRKAEWVLVTEEAQGLLKMSAVASASSSADVDSTSKGEEGCWAVTGAPLRVTCSDRTHFASDCIAAARHQAHVAQDGNARVAAWLQHQACMSSTPKLRLHAIHNIKSCHTTSQGHLNVGL